MLALIDSDTPVFATALASEGVELQYAKNRLDAFIHNIIESSGATEAKLFVSGEGNFRKSIDPSYKAHRPQESPKWREDLRLHLIDSWGAVECNGYEADDACGINQASDGSTIICGIDKDLLQIPGKHYQWPIIRKGEIVRPALYHDIDEETGWRNLFTQALTGDTSDNIKGVHGVGKVNAARVLEDCHFEEDMYAAVWYEYIMDNPEGEQRFHKNLDLLYIWRSLGITYSTRREINAI